MRPAVRGRRVRFHRAGIPEITAAVEPGIAVQQFEVASGLGHADDVVVPNHRREVDGDENEVR